jgi:hypothetical protein
MDMIRLEMAFQNLALFLTGKFMKNLTEVSPELQIERFSPVFRNPDHMAHVVH